MVSHSLSLTERQKVLLALIASAVVHLAFITVFIVSTWFKLPVPRITPPQPKPLDKAATPAAQARPKPTPVVVRVIKAVPLARPTPPSPPEKIRRSVLSNDGLTPAATPPQNATFEADINSRAASELPGRGDPRLPTQAGKERPFLQFETKAHTPGATPAPAAQPLPEATPVGFSQVQLTGQAAARPTPRFQPTPMPGKALARPTPKPAQTTLAVRQATATPAPTPVATPVLARLQPPKARSAAQASGYRPQTEKTRIEGGISNKGRASVAAVGTPLGRYRKAIADAIGSRWYHYVHQRMDLIAVGEVHIRFTVDAGGGVQNLEIVSNTANESFGTFCVQAVNEARIPPIPPEVLEKLQDNRLEIDYRFTIYPQ